MKGKRVFFKSIHILIGGFRSSFHLFYWFRFLSLGQHKDVPLGVQCWHHWCRFGLSTDENTVTTGVFGSWGVTSLFSKVWCIWLLQFVFLNTQPIKNIDTADVSVITHNNKKQKQVGHLQPTTPHVSKGNMKVNSWDYGSVENDMVKSSSSYFL